MSNLSFVQHAGDGVTTTFLLAVNGDNIGYLRTEDIHVYVDGVEVDFTIQVASPHLAILNEAPADGAVVIIRRQMPQDTTYSDFSRGNVFSPRNMNNSFLQDLYLTQELLDGFLPEGTYQKQDMDFGDEWAPTRLRAPVNDSDATSKVYVDDADNALDARVTEIENTVVAGDTRYISYPYKSGSADGGELFLTLPYVFETINRVFINGVHQTEGLAWDYDRNTQLVELAEELEAGDEVVIEVGLNPERVIDNEVVSGNAEIIATGTTTPRTLSDWFGLNNPKFSDLASMLAHVNTDGAILGEYEEGQILQTTGPESGLWIVSSDVSTPNTVHIESDSFIRPAGHVGNPLVPASQILDKSYVVDLDGKVINPIGPVITASQFGLGLLLSNVSSQSCSSNFSRSVNVGSIFSSCEGNTSANLAARLCYSKVAQSVNIGSEDCDSLADRTGNINTKRGLAEGVDSTNIASRRARTSANEGGQIACDTVLVGDGAACRLQAVVSGGVVTDITVLDGGSDYEVVPTILIQDKNNVGTGATATANVSSGVVTSVTVDSGGSGYPDGDDLTLVVRAEVADQQCFAAASLGSKVKGTNVALIADSNSTTAFDSEGVGGIANDSSNIEGINNFIAATQGSKVSGVVNGQLASTGSFTSSTNRGFLVASRNAELADSGSIGGGWSASGIVETGSNQNVTWTISSITGKGTFNGGIEFAGALLIRGTGSPEGIVTATVGSIYTREDGGAGTTLYVKESGSGNTGWVAK